MTQAFFPATPEESLGADTLTAQRLRTRADGEAAVNWVHRSGDRKRCGESVDSVLTCGYVWPDSSLPR
jgi:hypothetical protein